MPPKHYGTPEEKRLLTRRSNVLVLAALVLVFGGRALAGAALPVPVFLLVVLSGTVCWFWGLGAYARSKGYSPIIAVAGIFNIFGLLLLVVLPDLWKKSLAINGDTAPADSPLLTNYPR